MSNLSVTEYAGVLVVDSRLIAEQLDVQHKNVLSLIDRYLQELQEFGVIAFETRKSERGLPERFAWLNEDQATLLMTFSRNSVKVIRCKVELVAAFKKAREVIKNVIPEQNERLRELQLSNENLKMQLALVDRTNSMAIMHGVPTTLLLLGKGDHIEEVEKPTLEVIDERYNVRFSGQTTKQVADYVNKKFGTKLKSGADVVRALKRVEKDSLLAQTPRTVTAEYIPAEHLDEVYKILTNGHRQKLLGE